MHGIVKKTYGIAIIIGASSGIGENIAYCLAEESASESISEIWLIARRGEKLSNVAETVNKKAGREISKVFCADVTSKTFCDWLSENLSASGKSVSWFVNSAGNGFAGEFQNVEVEKNYGCIELNCGATVRVIGCILPYLKEGGRIIQLASGAAFFPQPKFAVYAASKAFVFNFSRALGEELKPRGISVTAVCPGPCDTEFLFLANQEGEIPKYKRKFMITPVQVAKKAVNSAKKRKKICIPSFSMKLLYVARKLIPDQWIIFFQNKL
jgi:short-subunit dehydrogenase